MEITTIEPIGYCAGVKNAINIAYIAKKENPDARIFVMGQLVHNKTVVDSLLKDGIISIKKDDIELLNDKDVVIFTAHGHSGLLENEVKSKGCVVYDATCPKVNNNLNIIQKEINNKHEIIYIGTKKHPETEAALSIGEAVHLYDASSKFDFSNVEDETPLVINQTTLNVDLLKKEYEIIKSNIPNARFMDEICSATRIRQNNIKNIAEDVDLILIIGDPNSSNTNKLVEVAKTYHKNATTLLVESVYNLYDFNFKNIKKAAVASGASTPLETISSVIEYLKTK